MEILCLGNEFIKEDSLAKKVSYELVKEGFNIVFIKDSFELMDKINSGDDFIIVDVVKNLNEVKIISVDDLKNSKLLSAHDFDAGFVLKLTGSNKNINIIGIPVDSDFHCVKKDLEKYILQYIH